MYAEVPGWSISTVRLSQLRVDPVATHADHRRSGMEAVSCISCHSWTTPVTPPSRRECAALRLRMRVPVPHCTVLCRWAVLVRYCTCTRTMYEIRYLSYGSYPYPYPYPLLVILFGFAIQSIRVTREFVPVRVNRITDERCKSQKAYEYSYAILSCRQQQSSRAARPRRRAGRPARLQARPPALISFQQYEYGTRTIVQGLGEQKRTKYKINGNTKYSYSYNNDDRHHRIRCPISRLIKLCLL